MVERLDLEGLEARLVDLGRALELPAAAPGLAASVAARLRAEPEPIRSRRRVGWVSLFGRPVRRSLLIAVVLLLALAAVAAAVGIWLPGLRIVTLPPGGSLASVERAVGAPLGLGTRVDVEDVAGLAGFEPVIPPRVGQPDEAYVADEVVTLVWEPQAGLPKLPIGDVGLLVTELRGVVDAGWYEKQIDSGASGVTPVRVGGLEGFWIDGAPHNLVYRAPGGEFVEESRRVVGEVLIWREGDLTFRIESALGREATIELAESMAGR